jgi:nitrogen fixation/metabolism regulation signal transduction histidine kinase
MSNSEFLRPIIQYLPLAVIVVDRERRILLANETAEIISKKTEAQLLDLRGGEALGCVYSDIHPDGCGSAKACDMCELKSAVEQAFKEEKSITLNDTTLNFKDIGVRHLRVSISYLNLDKINLRNNGQEERRKSAGRRKYDQNKEVSVVAMEDITGFKEKEKLEATFEVVGAICHEMNQPLQTVMGYSDLLMVEENPEILKEKAKILKEEIGRIGDLTRKLQNIKKYETRSYLSRKILDIDKSTK